jgi:hypothetical protein
MYSYKKSATIFSIVGLAVGLSAWVKNEGLLFAIIFLVVLVAISWLKKYYAQRSIFFALFSGFLVVFAFILFFKFSLAPENDLVTEQTTAAIWGNLGDLSRYELVWNAFFKTMWNLFQVPIIIFPLLLLFLGIDRQRLKQPVVSIGASTLILMLIGYFFVYVNTPYDIEWHLGTSLARLYLQLWPSFVFITMFMVQDFQWANASLKTNYLNELTDGDLLRSDQQKI